MLSLKILFESVVGQGRRAVLKTTRSKIGTTGPVEHFKLSEAPHQGRVGRPQPKGVISNHHCVAEGQKALSNSCSSISSGGGIVNLLRPITSRFFQGLVRRVSSPLWSEARRKSSKRLFGETAPYFALVGITLVSGPERGLLTAHDESEAVCEDIREAISRAGWIHNPSFWKHTVTSDYCKQKPVPSEEYSLSNFDISSAINKGCNAVVYAARWKDDTCNESTCTADCCGVATKEQEEAPSDQVVNVLEDMFSSGSMWSLKQIQSNTGMAYGAGNQLQESNVRETISSAEDMSQGNFTDASSSEAGDPKLNFEDEANAKESSFSGSFGSEPSNVESVASTSFRSNDSPLKPALGSALSLASSVTMPQDVDFFMTSADLSKRKGKGPQKRKRVKFKDDDKMIQAEEIENVTPVKTKPLIEEKSSFASCPSLESYPLAIKMMFNYEAESNAPAILRAMYKETLPAKSVQLDHGSIVMKQRLLNTTTSLPPHPNIVDMPCVFVDRIPSLSDGLTLYPDALPKRINPTGYGRNMSLFCVMRRYDSTLTEYLAQKKPSPRVSLLLLTQLLEAINHIHKYGISHRDLKSDNVLLCLREGFDSPHLVISDFGCCLPDPNLIVPFPSYEADPRVGNAALMAPEIKSATPGLFTKLNYAKSDLWACGTLAYEIFGLENPFACPSSTHGPSKKGVLLDSATYKESHLPKIPKTVPVEIRCLIQDMMKRNPSQRPSPIVAATLCQLSLWAPRKWLNRHSLAMPSNCEVMRWLLCLSTKVICEAGSSSPQDPADKGLFDVSEERTGGVLEYEIVSTFLKRVHYNDIMEAIRWTRAF